MTQTELTTMTPTSETRSRVARVRSVGRRLGPLGGPTILLAAVQLITQGFSFLGGLVLARYLGPVGRGQVSLVQTYDDVSTNVFAVGAGDAAAYFAKEGLASEGEVLGSALKISLFTIPVAAIAGWLVARYAMADFPVGLQVVAWTLIGMTPITNSFPNVCRMLLIARGQIRTLVPLNLAGTLLRIAALLSLVALDWFTPTTAALSFLVAGWSFQAMNWWVAKVRPQRGGPTKRLLRFGIKTVPASLASMANTRLDQLLVAPLLGTRELGIYAVAVGVNILPVTLATAIAQAGYHSVKGTRTQSTGGGVLIRKAAIGIGACALISAVGIAMLLEPLYGKEFADAVIPALVLVPGSAATGLFVVVWSTGNAIGDPGLAAKAQLIGLVVTVAGLPAGLILLGVNGGALVSSVVCTVRLLAGLWLLRSRGVHFRLRGSE
jgi:O-antigen/teichoic acid export membrane protein